MNSGPEIKIPFPTGNFKSDALLEASDKAMRKLVEISTATRPGRMRKNKLRPGKQTDPRYFENLLGLKRCKRNPYRFTNMTHKKATLLWRLQKFMRAAMKNSLAHNASSTESLSN